jgi:hypothetical protein
VANTRLNPALTFHGVNYHDQGISVLYSSNTHDIEIHWEYLKRGPTSFNMNVKPDYLGRAVINFVAMERLPLGHAQHHIRDYLEDRALQEAREIVGPLPPRLRRGEKGLEDLYQYALAIQYLYEFGVSDIVRPLVKWAGDSSGTDPVWRGRIAAMKRKGILTGEPPYMTAIRPEDAVPREGPGRKGSRPMERFD